MGLFFLILLILISLFRDNSLEQCILSNSLYAAIHPSENLNRKYSLPTTFEIQPKNILRYMLDSDFRELYKQWFSPTKKCDICYPKNQQIQPPVHMILCPNCVSRLATKLQTIQSIDVINSTNNKKN